MIKILASLEEGGEKKPFRILHDENGERKKHVGNHSKTKRAWYEKTADHPWLLTSDFILKLSGRPPDMQQCKALFGALIECQAAGSSTNNIYSYIYYAFYGERKIIK